MLKKREINAVDVLNKAYDYKIPSSFSRGLAIDLPGYTMIYISGTASVDELGKTVHVGDFASQCGRTFTNLTQLLKVEGADWFDVVRTTCYLKNIQRDYEVFNKLRTSFYDELKLQILPASTCIQAELCREDLLIEIELIAIVGVAEW